LKWDNDSSFASRQTIRENANFVNRRQQETTLSEAMLNEVSNLSPSRMKFGANARFPPRADLRRRYQA
jgi:hypothetical protein